MIADAIVRIVVEHVVLPTAEPDHRILGERIGRLDGRRRHRIGVLLSVGIDARVELGGNGLVRRIGVRGLLRLVGTTDPSGAQRDQPVTLSDLEIAVRPDHQADVGA